MSDTNSPLDTVLPVNLSRVVELVESSGLYTDLTIDGVPFNVKMSDENPLIRGLTDDRKDQFDSSGEAGEQTFGYWWLRSQASFHGGAGQEYSDTGVVNPAQSRLRFHESLGVYPFEPGQLTVSAGYNYGDTQASVVYATAVPVTRGGVAQIALMRTDSANIDFYNTTDQTYDTVSVGTGTPQAICSDGNRVFVAIDDSIQRINDDDSLTEIATLTFGDPIAIGYAKQRVILGHGRDLYEVDPNGSAVALTSTERIVQHANPDWAWNVISEGPSAIFAAGFSGPISSVFSISETDSGGTLVLGGALEQATMPTGEIIQSMIFYVNSLFALGTNMGLRVGSFTPYAQPQWGPLSIPGVSITSLTAVGSIIHAGSDDDKIYWLDLGTVADQTGRYAYACRAETPEALISLVATGTPVQVYSVTDNRVGREDATQDATGTFTSSWMVWNTTEPKRAHFLTVSGSFPGPAGTVEVETLEGITQQFVLPGGTTQTTFEFGLTGLIASDAFRVNITLNQDDGDQNVLRSWQLKALPEPRRYQQLIYPLLIEDIELRSSGERMGYDGFAADRLGMLEILARANAVVTVRDRLLNQQYQAMIREMQFVQDSGPEVNRPLGGIATVVLSLVS